MGKFTITESEKKRILSLHKKLISEQLNNVKEDEIPIVTYSNALHNPGHHYVYFNDVKGNLPSKGQIKLVNIRKPNSTREREDDIIINVNKFTTTTRQGNYKISDREPEVKNIKSFGDTKEKVVNTIGPNIINNKYKETIFRSLKDIYGGNSKTWSNEPGRGPRGQGGVINIYTLNDYLLDKGLEPTEGGEWSVLNYFDTNLQIKEAILKKFKEFNGNKPISTMEELDKWCSWIYEHKDNLFFKDKNVLKKLSDINFGSIYHGVFLNEKKAYDYISDLISGNENLSIVTYKPGSEIDRKGVDFTVINKTKDPEMGINHFQAKPFHGLSKRGDVYTVYSHNVRYVIKKDVKYYIFTSHQQEQIVIFEDKTDGIKPFDNYVEFNYPPISPQDLLKQL
jgi:hypothetical protein